LLFERLNKFLFTLNYITKTILDYPSCWLIASHCNINDFTAQTIGKLPVKLRITKPTLHKRDTTTNRSILVIARL